jgi:RHS repeat-associated protein
MAAAGHQRQQGGREPVLRSTPERKRSGHPYGAERWSSGTFPTDYRFTGQRFDSYTQLTIMGSRWYDGQIGRWISPDTIIPDFADPQSLNRYSYVLNRPLTLTDPSGHIASDEEEEALALIGQLCDAYGVCIEIDFGYVPYESPGPDDPVWMWAKGQWELRQLVALRDTAEYANQLYDRYQAGEITSLDVLCNLTDYRASIGSPETFVDDISTFILGERGGRAVWAPPLGLNRWEELKLSASGFSEFHQDPSNQVRHFWMYVHAAYTTGKPRLVTVGNWLHERKWLPGIGGRGASRQDYILGNKGRDLGMDLREGTVDLNQASDWIRREAEGRD